MSTKNFDSEYYVMEFDATDNRPRLNWGKTDNAPFRKTELIDENTLDLPLEIVFTDPFPDKPYDMADVLTLGVYWAGSIKTKSFFEKLNVYGVQFMPVEITSNNGEIISGHYAVHFWNRLPAIDKNNYEGGAPNRFGNILSLKKFSLDSEILSNVPLEKRLVFVLAEKPSMIIVHQSVYEAVQAANLTGMRFFRVDDWDDNAMFRC